MANKQLGQKEEQKPGLSLLNFTIHSVIEVIVYQSRQNIY